MLRGQPQPFPCPDSLSASLSTSPHFSPGSRSILSCFPSFGSKSNTALTRLFKGVSQNLLSCPVYDWLKESYLLLNCPVCIISGKTVAACGNVDQSGSTSVRLRSYHLLYSPDRTSKLSELQFSVADAMTALTHRVIQKSFASD